MPSRFLYIFLDESGNLDFSSNGTRFFQIAGVIQERPFESYRLLSELRYDLIEAGHDIQGFHATEDLQDIRNRVFAIIQKFLRSMRIDALIVVLPSNVRWRVLHHPSHCNFDLQIADYCSWAIFRKWNNGDCRSYDLIKSAIRKEFDIFARGSKYYY
jgi:Protein of unknown function (DUF3800)